MTLARTRALVAGFGIVVLAAVVAGLIAVGGPDAGRRDRRDAARLDALHRIADALACHVEAGAEPARPEAIAGITPSCLAPDDVAGLVDPRSQLPYRVDYPEPARATVCADFEQPPPDRRFGGRGSFDAATGCVSVSLTSR
jgi:hypothetical protein